MPSLLCSTILRLHKKRLLLLEQQRLFLLATFLAIAAKFYQEEAPLAHYLYAAFPCYFWSRIIDLRHYLNFFRISSVTIGACVILLFGLELCVLGYFQRVAWSIGLIALGTLWPLVEFSSDFRQANKSIGAAWSVACLMTAIFPILPVEKGECLPLLSVILNISSNLMRIWTDLQAH